MKREGPRDLIGFSDFLNTLSSFLPELKSFHAGCNVSLPFRTYHALRNFPKEREVLSQRKLLLSSVSVNVCLLCVQYLQRPKESMSFPGVGVTRSCEQLDMGAGNQMYVL